MFYLLSHFKSWNGNFTWQSVKSHTAKVCQIFIFIPNINDYKAILIKIRTAKKFFRTTPLLHVQKSREVLPCISCSILQAFETLVNFSDKLCFSLINSFSVDCKSDKMRNRDTAISLIFLESDHREVNHFHFS